MTMLVTGATGNVGREVLAQLVATGNAARALVRDARRLPGGVEGDLGRPETLRTALAGVETVFLVWPFLSADGVSGVLEVIGAHARRVVYLSSSGVDVHDDPINRLHADVEAAIRASGLEWTMLRANTIASNTRGWSAQIRENGVVRGPDIAATAVVDPRDVAAVAVRVLTSGGHAEATYVLTGPEVVSRGEQVAAIGRAVGRPLRFEPVPVKEARRQMLADGRPPALVEALLASAEQRPHSGLVTSTVAEITGRAARTFGQWADDHADDFR